MSYDGYAFSQPHVLSILDLNRVDVEILLNLGERSWSAARMNPY